MRIFMISRGIPSDSEPQWGCFEKDQAEALSAIGHEVTVLSVDTRFRFRWRKLGVTHTSISGVEYYNVFLCPLAIVRKIIGFETGQSLVYRQLRWLYKLASDNGKKRPDILYSQFVFNTCVATRLMKEFGLPLAGIEHLARYNNAVLTKDTQLMTKAAYSDIDRIITVSSTLRESLKKHTGKDSVVIRNTVGREFYYAGHTSTDTFRLVSVGSLEYRKGFDLLIKALSNIGMNGQEWHLHIIGDGPERNTLQNMISESGVDKRITIEGKKGKEEIADMLRQCDAFVLPSRNENFSVAVLEAQACGLPVIASLCGDIKECVDDSNGMIFPVDDDVALKHCIEKMMSEHSKYDRKYIADQFQSRFGSEVIARKLTEVFESVLKEKKNK